MANPKRNATDLELAYLAGIVDGEGCICAFESRQYVNKKKPSVNPDAVRFRYKVCVKMVDPEPVNLLMDVFGGQVYIQRPRQRGRFPQFTWQVSELRAAKACEQLLPYLRIKRERAAMLLQLSSMVAKHRHAGRGVHVPEHEYSERRDLLTKMKGENARLRLSRLATEHGEKPYKNLSGEETIN